MLALASMGAGCIDAIVGGGGLILLPALFVALPSTAPTQLIATNKGAAIWGTAWAARSYLQRVRLPWRSLVGAMAAGFIGSVLGAWTLTHINAQGLRQALPVVLAALLIYTLTNKQLGRDHAPRLKGRAEALAAAAIGLAIGFYDGLFGPGTGSFFVFLLVRVLGYDFLHASAAAKLLNTATNASSLMFFAWAGHVIWPLALVLAIANVAGSLLGTRLALKHGAGFVRGAFVLVVAALIVKTAWDAFAH